MLLQRFYDSKLAQASYLVGCQRTGEALVIDPTRDAEQYVAAARAEGLRITHVTETHIHADYVSGSRELVARAGAGLHLSDKGGPDWTYAFAKSDGAVLLKNGAGSACGKALGAVPSSTVGYERFANWGLATLDEERFVRQVLEGQSEPPKYFARMKRVNKEGPRVLGGFAKPERLPASRLPELLKQGALVLDTRRTADHMQGHVPGTLNVPLSSSFPTYAGSVLPYDRPIYLLVDHGREGAVDEAVRALASIGLDNVAGSFGADALDAWRKGGKALGTVPQVSPQALAARLAAGEILVVDVRNRSEWDAGHLKGAHHVPLATLTDHRAELPTDRPLVVQCETGSRSAVAASVLRSHGFTDVTNAAGGLEAWRSAGLPVETETPASLAGVP